MAKDVAEAHGLAIEGVAQFRAESARLTSKATSVGSARLPASRSSHCLLTTSPGIVSTICIKSTTPREDGQATGKVKYGDEQSCTCIQLSIANTVFLR